MKVMTRQARPCLEILEDRITPVAVNWTGGGMTSSFTDVGNWDVRVPTQDDDVVIDSVGVGKFQECELTKTDTPTVKSLNITNDGYLWIHGTMDKFQNFVVSNGIVVNNGGRLDMGQTGAVTGILITNRQAGIVLDSGANMFVLGSAPVTNRILGNLYVQSTASLHMGTDAGTYTRLDVWGTLSLTAGTLDIEIDMGSEDTAACSQITCRTWKMDNQSVLNVRENGTVLSGTYQRFDYVTATDTAIDPATDGKWGQILFSANVSWSDGVKGVNSNIMSLYGTHF